MREITKKIKGITLIAILAMISGLNADESRIMNSLSVSSSESESIHYFNIQDIGHSESLQFEFSMNQLSAENTNANTDALIVDDPLPYPTPMSWSKGDGIIAYRLSRDVEITIQLFDMRGRKIAEKIYQEGSLGAREGYNRVPINRNVINANLSTAVYRFLILADGKIIAKNKMGVVR